MTIVAWIQSDAAKFQSCRTGAEIQQLHTISRAGKVETCNNSIAMRF
jgi:hypothetical protein